MPIFRDTTKLSKWTAASLAGVAVLLLASIPVDLLQWSRYSILQRGHLVVAGEEQALDAVTAFVVVSLGVLYLAAAILFLLWTYRVVSNLPALRATELRYRPGWAVGWWFIPLANWVMPYLVLAEAWKASDPRTGPSNRKSRQSLPVGGLLAPWWLLWVFGQCASVGIHSPSAADPSAALSPIPGSALWIPAAVLGAFVTMALARRQRHKAAALASTPADAAP